MGVNGCYSSVACALRVNTWKYWAFSVKRGLSWGKKRRENHEGEKTLENIGNRLFASKSLHFWEGANTRKLRHFKKENEN